MRSIQRLRLSSVPLMTLVISKRHESAASCDIEQHSASGRLGWDERCFFFSLLPCADYKERH